MRGPGTALGILAIALLLVAGLSFAVESSGPQGVSIDSEFSTWGHDIVFTETTLVLSDSLGLDLYARGGTGYQFRGRVETDNVSFLALSHDQLAAIEEYGRVRFLDVSGGGLRETSGFDIPPDVSGDGYEFFAVARSESHVVAGGRLEGNWTRGIVWVLELNGTGLVNRGWPYYLPEQVTDIDLIEDGFAVSAGGVYLVTIGAPGQAPVLGSSVRGTEGARKLALSPSEVLIVRKGGPDWSGIGWATIYFDRSWGVIRTRAIDDLMVGPSPWVGDVEHFSGSFWLAIRDAPLYKIRDSGTPEVVNREKVDYEALYSDGVRLGTLHRGGVTILVTSGQGGSLAPALTATALLLGSVFALVIWKEKRAKRRKNDENRADVKRSG